MNEQYSIKIPVFEGPLDLLLHLIKKNEIDVYDIPIALITGQYLEYIGLMKELNLEVAGDFLVMAATLIQIKSRMLLPQDEQAPEEEAEDPRLELVQRLIEYQAFKEAALDLGESGQWWSPVRYRPDAAGAPESEDGDLAFPDVSLFDLISAFRKVLKNAPAELQNITRQTLNLNDCIARTLEALEGKETVRFEELFPAGASKSLLIMSFVAVLEILKLGLARVYQEEKFGPIWIVRAQQAKNAPSVRDIDGQEATADQEVTISLETGILEEPALPEEVIPLDIYGDGGEDGPKQ